MSEDIPCGEDNTDASDDIFFDEDDSFDNFVPCDDEATEYTENKDPLDEIQDLNRTDAFEDENIVDALESDNDEESNTQYETNVLEEEIFSNEQNESEDESNTYVGETNESNGENNSGEEIKNNEQGETEDENINDVSETNEENEIREKNTTMYPSGEETENNESTENNTTIDQSEQKEVEDENSAEESDKNQANGVKGNQSISEQNEIKDENITSSETNEAKNSEKEETSTIKLSNEKQKTSEDSDEVASKEVDVKMNLNLNGTVSELRGKAVIGMTPPVSVSLDLTPNDTNLSFSRHVEDDSDIFNQNEDENSGDSSGDVPNVSDGGNELNINARMENNNLFLKGEGIIHLGELPIETTLPPDTDKSQWETDFDLETTVDPIVEKANEIMELDDFESTPDPIVEKANEIMSEESDLGFDRFNEEEYNGFYSDTNVPIPTLMENSASGVVLSTLIFLVILFV